LIVVATPVLAWTVAVCQAQEAAKASAAANPASAAEAVRLAVREGEICFRLTTPAELKAMLGAPTTERQADESFRKTLALEYPSVQATFSRFSEVGGYGLVEITVAGKPLDIGRNQTVTLRRVSDLAKLDSFFGATNVSLARLDLTGQQSRLNTLPFSSGTHWPPASKLPRGFDPARILEACKNPGIGVRKLHEEGIDGRGVHIAIIDQPLLQEHHEYKDRVVEYETLDMETPSPAMHGTAVTSIAVGKTCGTAPAASVHFYAVPTWKWWNEHCKPYAATLDRIVDQNRQRPAGQKVKVVSISLGAFSQWPDHELWAKAVKRAANEGILVLSCDPAYLRIVLLQRDLAGDPELPAGYTRHLLLLLRAGLGVPAGNRATAYVTGPDDYIFWREGGMSWTPPYLAGLAALALQVNPELKPDAIPDLWMKTATKTVAGSVVNPRAFLEAARKGAAPITR
jgi:hypothetical protein